MQVVRVRMLNAFHNLGHDNSSQAAWNLLDLLEGINLKSDGCQGLGHCLRSEVTLKVLLEPIVRNLHIFLLLNYSISSFEKRELTNSFLSKTLRSSIPSPIPTNLIGTRN